MDMQEKYRQQLDISYSYHLAKRMEKHRTNEELGYRTAGSKAELATGEMLEQEMHTIGFPIIHKDAITVDAWEFERAKMTFLNEKGEEETIQLGAYQTNFVTDGPECYSVVYAGRGTLQDYEGMDVTGKLVLVDINQRDEWWINYPVYQAHLKGAAAVIAAQTGGYGEVDERARTGWLCILRCSCCSHHAVHDRTYHSGSRCFGCNVCSTAFGHRMQGAAQCPCGKEKVSG